METAFAKALSDPVIFAQVFFNFHATNYQAKLLKDQNKRIIARWSRQAGKTSTLALRSIWYALSHPKTLTLIVAPSLRQSMIMSDRVQDFLLGLPPKWRNLFISKQQRTSTRFQNRSQIVALPNSPQLLRGYTAHQVICFPASVKVLIADGTEVPISNLKKGQMVLSYNFAKNCVEPQRVLRVFKRKYRGPLVEVSHQFDALQCTPNHKIYTPASKVAAINLNTTDHLLYASDCFAQGQTAKRHSATVPLWGVARRLFHFEPQKQQKKLSPPNPTQLTPSRVRHVQIFANEGFCANTPKNSEESGMGQRVNALFYACLSSLHRSIQNLLHKRSQDFDSGMAEENHPSVCPRYLVYGRRELSKVWDANHKHAQLFSRGALSHRRLAREKLGHSFACERGYEGQRIFPIFFGSGTRQVSQIDQTVHNTEHGLQVYAGYPEGNMSSLRSELYAEKECLWSCQGSELEPLLQPEVLQICSSQEILQSKTCSMCYMRSDFHSSHGKPSDLQSEMQEGISSPEEERTKQVLKNAKEIDIFNIEVEGNHNYFANRALVANCEEAAFFRDDNIMFYNVLYPMLATTDGALVVSSTPWSKDSVFYRMAVGEEFSKHLVTWKDVVEAGLIKQEFIEEMRTQIPDERFQREFNAQFVEDIDAWLPQSLIVSCIDSHLDLADFRDSLGPGNFYVGVDFGKHQDYSVVVVFQKFENTLKLIHVHRFSLGTEYASVIGYIDRSIDLRHRARFSPFLVYFKVMEEQKNGKTSSRWNKPED